MHLSIVRFSSKKEKPAFSLYVISVFLYYKKSHDGDISPAWDININQTYAVYCFRLSSSERAASAHASYFFMMPTPIAYGPV